MSVEFRDASQTLLFHRHRKHVRLERKKPTHYLFRLLKSIHNLCYQCPQEEWAGEKEDFAELGLKSVVLEFEENGE